MNQWFFSYFWDSYFLSHGGFKMHMEPCHWSEGRHNNIGVSLRERQATMQVMLGVSLRARWDATLVRWIKLTRKPSLFTVTSMTLIPVCFAAVKVDVTADVKNIDKAARCKLHGTFSISLTPLHVCLLSHAHCFYCDFASTFCGASFYFTLLPCPVKSRDYHDHLPPGVSISC